MGDLRPRVLAILPGFIPSTIINVVKPLLQLHRTGRIQAEITMEYMNNNRRINWADLVVLCRNNEPRYAFLLDILRSKKIPFIYDIDDNLFEYPLCYTDWKEHRSQERLTLLTDYMRFANLVRVYSNPFQEKAATLNQRVEKVFGPTYQRLISSPHVHPDSERIKLVYATSRSQDKLYELFTPALIRVLNDYPSRVEAHFWGYNPVLPRTGGKIYYHKFVSNYDRFLQQFSQAGFDIGMAPLLDDLFHRSKTNIKFRDYGACWIAGIYSNVDVYSDCVVEGETGLLVPNEPEAWYRAMVRLIEDGPLREKIKRQAQEYVCTQYGEDRFVKGWQDQIERVMTEKGCYLLPGLPTVQSKTAIVLRGRLNYLLRYFRQNGFSGLFKVLKRHLFSRWMVLRFRLQTLLR
jgi:glycosyltransferase involved in cell wall biosynthesis